MDVALKVLIILCEKVAYFHESYVFFNYLQSIGGESLLEYVSNIASDEHSSSRTTHSLEDISEKCYYLLNGLKMHSR